MTRRADLSGLVDTAVGTAGAERVAEALRSLVRREAEADDTLTLISNAGVHTIPDRYLRGVVYEVSRGDWAVSTAVEVREELMGLLHRLARKLRSRPWRQVYLVPTGHPVLTVNVKLLVYRLLRINTIDLYYKAGQYIEVEIDHRRLSLQTESDDSRGGQGDGRVMREGPDALDLGAFDPRTS